MESEIDYQQKYQQAQAAVQQWVAQQGHNRCWYYPDIFNRLVEILGIEANKTPALPPLEEFRKGCEEYQKEEYKKSGNSEK